MAETEAKLNLSLDDIISKTSKSGTRAGAGKVRGAGKPAGVRTQRNGAAKGPAAGAKARALGVAVGKTATKRQAAAPRRGSTGSIGAGRRRVVIDEHDDRMMDSGSALASRRPRLLDTTQVRAALDGSGKWAHDKFVADIGGGRPAARRAETGHKLVITNLDYKVSDEDIKELFEPFGAVKRAGILYDRSGRSEEKAEVVFVQKAEALAAMKRYNNVSLDGKAMHIELAVPGAGRTVELSSGIRMDAGWNARDTMNRLSDRLGGRLGGNSGGGGGGGGRSVTRGSGNMRSAQGSGGRGGRNRGRNAGGDFMEE